MIQGALWGFVFHTCLFPPEVRLPEPVLQAQEPQDGPVKVDDQDIYIYIYVPLMGFDTVDCLIVLMSVDSVDFLYLYDFVSIFCNTIFEVFKCEQEVCCGVWISEESTA